MASNSTTGSVILIVTFSIFFYFTFWTGILPFMLVESDNWIFGLFPPLEYAFIVPVAYGILFIGGLLVFSLVQFNFNKYTVSISDHLHNQMALWLTIGISGVTCGGKTMLANNLHQYLADPKNINCLHKNIQITEVKSINQDNYFLPEDHPQHTKVEKLNHINWEIISALNVERMCDDIAITLGENFHSYNVKRRTKDNIPFQCQHDQSHGSTSMFTTLNHHYLHEYPIQLKILIIEGFLIFNHHYTLDICDIKFFLHLPYEKCFERRTRRVYSPPDIVGYFEMIVWPYYEKHFKQIKDRTDINKLNGELSQERLLNFLLNYIINSL